VTEPTHDISVEGFIESFDRRYPTFILKTLLCDRTTGRNIIWADNEYEALGDGYMGDDEITVEKITGMNSGVIKPRIAKEQEKQSQRTKSRAEVFTPSWLCNQMNNDLDETWFGQRDIFNTETVADNGANTWMTTDNSIEFPKSKGHGWRAYVEAPRLEITCGEAPFVCSRYDTVTGDELPVSERVGFLDRKLRVVTEKTKTRKEWVRRALDALRATYGFEYQGDNLLIARINVLETFTEHLRNRWGSDPQQDELEQAAWIVSWNFWQMNGFTDAVPTNKMGAEVESTLGTFEEPEPEPIQPSLFDLFDDVFPDETTEETKEEEPKETVPLCVIYDWQNGEPFEFATLKGKAANMGKKFYAVIGNPPYQISDGGAQRSAVPIYNKFIEQAVKLEPDTMSMIVPARWYAGGRGLDEFRKNMLADTRLSKLHDFPETSDCFPGLNRRGGVCYFIWKSNHRGECEVVNHFKGNTFCASRYLMDGDGEFFVRWNKGMEIIDKVRAFGEDSFSTIVSASKPFGLRAAFKDFKPAKDPEHNIKLYRFGNDGYIGEEQVAKGQEFINEWKVIVPEASPGADDYPHLVLSKPIVSEPDSICTETYLMIGPFGEKATCQNVCSYMVTRFFRFLVLMLKNTQHTTRKVYQFVPLQDFDRPWTDSDLYQKYGITDEEASFISELVKER